MTIYMRHNMIYEELVLVNSNTSDKSKAWELNLSATFILDYKMRKVFKMVLPHGFEGTLIYILLGRCKSLPPFRKAVG